MQIDRRAYEAIEPEITDLGGEETGHFSPYQDRRTVHLPDPREAGVRWLRFTIFRCGACEAKAPSLDRLRAVICDETRRPPFTL